MLSQSTLEVASRLDALSSWASALSFEDIPRDVQQRAALVIADDLACAVASRVEPEMAALASQLVAPSGESQIFLKREMRSDRATAAMINAVASNWCQLDEGHREVMCHAGLYVVPAVCADAEASEASVKHMIRAAVIGYEVVCRMAKAFRFREPTAHPHAMWSAVGAAASLAALRGLDDRHFRQALEAAATMAFAGPFRHGIRGALIQNMWAGIGITCAFKCLDWVACGITALDSSPFDVFGGVLGATIDARPLAEGLGESWELRSGYHKVHACAQQSHAAVEAALRLHSRWPRHMPLDQITRVTADVHALGLSMDNRHPHTSLAARFSIPHVISAVLVNGRTDAEAFGVTTLNDAAIGRIRQLVELRIFSPALPPPHDRAARVAVTFADGLTLSEECVSAQGGPDQPYPVNTILKKCRNSTQGEFPAFGGLARILWSLNDELLGRQWRDVVGCLTESKVR